MKSRARNFFIANKNFLTSLKELFFLLPQKFFLCSRLLWDREPKKKFSECFQKFFLFARFEELTFVCDRFFIDPGPNSCHSDVITNVRFLGFGTGSARDPGRPPVALGGGIQFHKFRRFSPLRAPPLREKMARTRDSGVKKCLFIPYSRPKSRFFRPENRISGVSGRRDPPGGGLFRRPGGGTPPPGGAPPRGGSHFRAG